jgi:hypothetical protein
MNEIEVERLRPAIGLSAAYYIKSFERIAARGGWALGWNLAAFLHSTAWFCFRRMYLWSAVNFFGPLLLFGAVAVLPDGSGAHPVFGTLRNVLVVGYLAAVFVVVPIFANTLYYRHLSRRLARGAGSRPATVWSALGGAALVIAVAVLQFSVGTVAYNDYGTRLSVIDAYASATGLASEVSRFHQLQKRLPNAEEAVQFRSNIPPWVERVAYDATEKRIEVALGYKFLGKRFALIAVEVDGRLSWRCRSIDLAPRLLPRACRE